MSEKKKYFFSRHAKSSAMLISLIVHAIIIMIALTAVVFTQINKKEQTFEVKEVKRPKMKLRKLKVPVKVQKKSRPKPKMRKVIVAKQVKVNMPDFVMPEVANLGGSGGFGTGNGGGEGSGIGFSLPEINVFGLRSKGEKVFIILDSSTEMMFDEVGGIPAYTIIKKELVNILGGLPPSTLFNVAVYDLNSTYALFPQMVPANQVNVNKVEEWLAPLNAAKAGMREDEYGVDTLGPGGELVADDFLTGKFETQELWYTPTMLAMSQRADSVFLLTYWWGYQRIETGNNNYQQWTTTTSAGKKWASCYEKGKKMLDDDNKRRLSRGEPPRAINRDNAWNIIDAYFPGIEYPPNADFYYHAPMEYAQAMVGFRNKNKPTHAFAQKGRQKKSKQKIDFSYNVVRFAKKDAEWSEWYDQRTQDNFTALTKILNGEYKTIAGLEAIRSSAGGGKRQ